jgi:hypothetical protein
MKSSYAELMRSISRNNGKIISWIVSFVMWTQSKSVVALIVAFAFAEKNDDVNPKQSPAINVLSADGSPSFFSNSTT